MGTERNKKDFESLDVVLRNRQLRQRSISRMLLSAPRIDQTAPTFPDGWQSYAQWQNSTVSPVTRFETKLTVPEPPPQESGQLIYLFNGLETNNAERILQPVLQWGRSPAPGSGKFWAAASWWMGKEEEEFFISSLVRVNPGSEMLGRITLNSEDSGRFQYDCEFVGISGTKLSVGNIPALTICSEVLEAYNINNREQYPANRFSAFENITLELASGPAPLIWTIEGAFPPTVVDGSPTGGKIEVTYPTTGP